MITMIEVTTRNNNPNGFENKLENMGSKLLEESASFKMALT